MALRHVCRRTTDPGGLQRQNADLSACMHGQIIPSSLCNGEFLNSVKRTGLDFRRCDVKTPNTWGHNMTSRRRHLRRGFSSRRCTWRSWSSGSSRPGCPAELTSSSSSGTGCAADSSPTAPRSPSNERCHGNRVSRELLATVNTTITQKLQRNVFSGERVRYLVTQTIHVRFP